MQILSGLVIFVTAFDVFADATFVDLDQMGLYIFMLSSLSDMAPRLFEGRFSTIVYVQSSYLKAIF